MSSITIAAVRSAAAAATAAANYHHASKAASSSTSSYSTPPSPSSPSTTPTTRMDHSRRPSLLSTPFPPMVHLEFNVFRPPPPLAVIFRRCQWGERSYAVTVMARWQCSANDEIHRLRHLQARMYCHQYWRPRRSAASGEFRQAVTQTSPQPTDLASLDFLPFFESGLCLEPRFAHISLVPMASCQCTDEIVDMQKYSCPPTSTVITFR